MPGLNRFSVKYFKEIIAVIFIILIIIIALFVALAAVPTDKRKEEQITTSYAGEVEEL